MNTNLYLNIGSFTYNVEISRKIRKTITIQVTDKYTINVKSPFFILDETIKEFIHTRANWIKMQNQKIIDSQIYIKDGENIPFLGKQLRLKFSKDCKKATQLDNSLFIPKDKNIHLNTEKWYKKRAKEIIKKEVDFWANVIGLDFNKIYIKNQKTRWGSCSAKGNLNFNWKIILTTRSCLKYLVIHELCHLIEMNHSSKFWTLVSKYDSNYLENKRALKNYSALLSTNIFS